MQVAPPLAYELVEVATMMMSSKYACAVSIDLGLVISLMNRYEGVEAARG